MQATQKKEKLSTLAAQQFQSSHFEQAIKTGKKLLQLSPNNFMGLQIIAFSHYRLGNLDSAKAFVEKALKIKPQQAELYNTLGCIHKDGQEWKLGEQNFNKAIALNNNYTSAYYNLALLQHLQNKPALAQINYQKVLNLNTNHRGARIGLAQTLIADKKIQQAEHHLQTYLAQNPNDIDFQQQLAPTLMENGYLDKANTLALSILQQDPNHSDALYIAGNFFAEQKDYEAATKKYTQLLKTQPEHSGALQNLAFVYEKQKDYAAAEVCYIKLTSKNPENLTTQYQLARMYRLQKKHQMGEKTCAAMVKKWPLKPEPYFEYGTLLNEQKNFDRAESYFLKTLEIDKKYVEAWDNLGFSFCQRAMFEEAITCYENAVQIDREHNHVQMNLGLSLLTMGKFNKAWQHYFYRPRFLLPNDRLSTIVPDQNLNNKRVLIIRAQGIGDELLFLRFVKLLKQQGAWICYRCNNKIKTLLERLPYLDKVIGELEYEDNIDLSYSVDDLPLLLSIDDVTKILPPIRLFPLPESIEKIKIQLPNTSLPIIGITWRAGLSTEPVETTSVNLLNKQINLSNFLSLFEGIDAYFVILQRNPTCDEIEYLSRHFSERLINLNELNENLEDMLALLDSLNTYVGVSNTNMHLLAALGKSAHVLIPNPPEWRWFDKDTSLWMPGFVCYRQEHNQSWEKGLSAAAHNIRTQFLNNREKSSENENFIDPGSRSLS